MAGQAYFASIFDHFDLLAQKVDIRPGVLVAFCTCRGRVWYANFQHGGKQHRESLKTSSKKEARRRALKIEGELDNNRWKPAAKPTTIDEAITAYRDYLKAEDRRKRTLAKYYKVFDRVRDLACQRHVTSLASLDIKFIDAYRRQRSEEGAKSKTRYTESVIIRQLVNFALSRDMLDRDPLKGLKLKKPKPTRQPCWTFEEMQQIVKNSPAEIRPALLLLGETGMRFGELQWLTWEDVGDQANVLRIRPKDDWKPKSGDERAIPLNAAVKEVLASLPQRYRWVVTKPPSRRHPQPGRQWTERRLLAALKRVLKRLGLEGKLHTFRHTFISNALMKGIPVAVVREWVGHVDPEIIRLYTHVHDNASQAAMQRLAEANLKELQQGEQNNGQKDPKEG